MSNNLRALFGVAVILVCASGVVGAEASRATRSGEGTDATVHPQLPAAPLRVVAFYSPTCIGCKDLEKALASTAERWGGRIRIERHKLKDIDDFKDLFDYEDLYEAEEDDSTKVFVGEQYMVGTGAIVGRLNDVIARELEKGSVTLAPPTPETQETAESGAPDSVPAKIKERFKGFKVGAVGLAGLVDGVNPCAFTTIVFLLSMLAYLGKSRRQLAVVGVGFTAAVFVTYFLLGLGALHAIKSFSVGSGIARAITYVVAAMALGLSVWSLIDFIRYKLTGDVKKATLGLPKSIRAKVNKVIREGLKTRGLLVGSVSIGFLVALLESLCTGQVYLPTLVFVLREPSLRTAAIGYLLFYNAMFILPLAVILVVSYLGVGSDRLGRFLRGHLGALKLAMAVVFAGLGIFLLATV